MLLIDLHALLKKKCDFLINLYHLSRDCGYNFFGLRYLIKLRDVIYTIGMINYKTFLNTPFMSAHTYIANACRILNYEIVSGI